MLTRKLSEEFAQTRDQDFTAQNDDRGQQRPAVDAVLGGEHQKAGRDQELVGDRIEHLAERGLLTPHAGEIAVEDVGHAGGDEDRQRQPTQP